MSGFGAEFLLTMLKQLVIVGMTCVFALGGAVVGTITGALTGQTTETGFVRGAGIGAIAGAVVAVELLESLLNGESSSSKVLEGWGACGSSTQAKKIWRLIPHTVCYAGGSGCRGTTNVSMGW